MDIRRKFVLIAILAIFLPTTVNAFVHPNSLLTTSSSLVQDPIINHPDDIYIGSDESVIINWTINTAEAEFFQVVRNGNAIMMGYPENTSIVVNITDYAEGEYIFTLLVTDNAGIVYDDSVFVTVYFVGSEGFLNQSTTPVYTMINSPLVLLRDAVVSICFIGLLLKLRKDHLEPLQKERPKVAIVIQHNKALAAVIILIILFGVYPFGKWVVLNPNPYIRVAVIDSGIDPIPELYGRIVAQKSFVTPEMGYSITDLTTSDSRPHGRQHGTNVAILVAESRYAAIVNCKIGTADEGATTLAFVSAVRWAVEDQNCTIINYSYGGSILANDAHEEVVEWAFKRGVLFVSSAGNEGWEITGNSVSTPGIGPYCLTVGSSNELNEKAPYSSKGVTRDYIIKPEIYAYGSIDRIISTSSGTSYASPRIAAAATDLVHHCNSLGLSYSPGMLIAALTATSYAPRVSRTYEDIVGGGIVDLSAAINLIDTSSVELNTPSITSVLPRSLPVALDHLFLGDSYRFTLSVFCSGVKNFSLRTEGPDAHIIEIPPWVVVNQTAHIPIVLNLPGWAPSPYLDAILNFETDEGVEASVDIDLQVGYPTARIAVDVSHSLNATHSKYGRYLEMFEYLTNQGISVTEINYLEDFTLAELQNFDAMFILSPYSISMDEKSIIEEYSAIVPYNDSERNKLQQYYENGGRIFLAGNFFSRDQDNQGDRPMVAAALNQLLNWTPISFENFTWGRTETPIYVEGVYAHSVTQDVEGIQWAGAGLQITTGANPLFWLYEEAGNASTIKYLMATVENPVSGGRLVVSGSELFLSNDYLDSGDEHKRLLYNIMSWLT